MSEAQLNTTASSRRAPFFRTVLCAALAMLALLPSGCVRRRLNVRTNPPGALVYVDNQLIGTTPCGVDFTYYGTREIRLVKPGYETLSINQPIPTPWYECPPIDFVSENLVPTTIRDNRTVIYDLQPQIIVPAHALIERGELLRRDTNVGPLPVAPGIVVPPGVTAPPAGTILPTPGSTILPPPPGTMPPPSAIVPPPVSHAPPSTIVSPPPGNFPPPAFTQPPM